MTSKSDLCNPFLSTGLVLGTEFWCELEDKFWSRDGLDQRLIIGKRINEREEKPIKRRNKNEYPSERSSPANQRDISISFKDNAPVCI